MTNDSQTPNDDSRDGDDARLRAALAELRRAQVPPNDLWQGIAARLRPVLTNSTVDDDAVWAERLATLRVDQAPQRALWPGIESRIRARRLRQQRAPWLASAAVAASVLVALSFQVWRSSGPQPLHGAPLRASAEVVAAMQEAPDPALQQASVRSLAPETRALIRANLKIVNTAETQLRRALDADPDAAYLENLLNSTRQQKQDLRVVLADEH